MKMKQYQIVLSLLIFAISACAPYVYDVRDSSTPLPADLNNKMIKPFSKWSLNFQYENQNRNFQIKMPLEISLYSINTAKNTQRSIAEFVTQDGLRAFFIEDEGDGVTEIFIFENPKIDLKPMVIYGKYLQFDWDITKEKLYECYLYNENYELKKGYLSDSHFGLYESRYGRKLQKNGCTFKRNN